MRQIAARHGCQESSLRRHRDTHLRRALARTIESERIEIDAERLITWAHALHAKTLVILERADSLDDLGNARGLIGQARKNLELLGRLAGVLEGPKVAIDMRRRVAILGKLDEDALRALASGDVVEGEAVEEQPYGHLMRGHEAEAVERIEAYLQAADAAAGPVVIDLGPGASVAPMRDPAAACQSRAGLGGSSSRRGALSRRLPRSPTALRAPLRSGRLPARPRPSRAQSGSQGDAQRSSRGGCSGRQRATWRAAFPEHKPHSRVEGALLGRPSC